MTRTRHTKSFLKVAAIATAGMLCVAAAMARESHGPPVLAKELAPPRTGDPLIVTSGAFLTGATLDDRFTQNGENISPPIEWSRGPPGTRSYAILLEDAGVKGPDPVTHWIVYDIPATRLRLSEDQPPQTPISGAMQGMNVQNNAGFVGPNPPVGETHPYHIQVFALNTRLKLDPKEAYRDDVVKAMKGHVLASGDLVVNYTGK